MYTKVKNKEFIYCAICTIVSFVVAYTMIYPGHNWGGDFSQYIAQTRALATGTVAEWYVDNCYIINHSSPGLGSHAYPWGFPLLMLPLYLMFGENIMVFKVLIIVMFSASILLCYRFFAKKMPASVASFFTLFIALNPVYQASTDSVQSDIPCMFFSLLSIYFVDIHLKSEKHKISAAVLSGLCMALSVQMRTMAFALILALLCVDICLLINQWIYIYIQKEVLPIDMYYKKKWWYHLIPYGTFGVAYMTSEVFLVSAGGTYLGYFGMDCMKIMHMIEKYVQCFREVFGVFAIVFLAFAVIGVFFCIQKELYMVIYVAGMLVMLFVYDYYQGARFLFSVFPYIYLFSYYGMVGVFRKAQPKKINIGIICFAIIVLCLYLRSLYVNDWSIRHGITYEADAYSEDVREVYDYINNYIDDDKVIYFFKPRVLYLNTNNRSYTREDCVEAMKETDYWLFWVNDFLTDCQAHAAKQEDCELLFQNNQFMLYKKGKE